MKITDVEAYVVQPNLGEGAFVDWQWTFVRIDTDEGITGWGEASNTPRRASLLTGQGVRAVREALVGEDPSDIERLWHKLYRRYTYLGARGLPTTVISGVDIALWDIKGKALSRPVYDLLGGKFRDSVVLYANAWFTGCQTPEQYAEAAKKAVASGHDALKLDPFREMAPFHTQYVTGGISADGEELGVNIVAAIRAAVGPKVEILIDAHGHYNVPTAIRLANRLMESNITWFEEPVPPESYGALRQVRENTSAPICVGERLFTRYDFVPVFEQRLADYVMPDVVWTGGISELKKIATMAEAHYVPISPHNALGPLQIIAGANVMMTTPNFYRLEHAVAFIPSYNYFLKEPIDFTGNQVRLSGRPGLGVEMDLEKIRGALHEDWQAD